MSSNYEWQKQYTRQRVGDAHRMAEAHRLARAGRPERSRGILASLAAAVFRLKPHRPVIDSNSIETPRESTAI